DRIRPAAGHRGAAREARRAEGLDAVRQRAGPGPGDGAAHRDRVHGRVRAPIVAAHEFDSGADRHGADQASSPAATTAATAAIGTGVAATPCERRERHDAHYSDA